MASLKLNLGTTGHDHTESADTKVTIDFALPDGSSYSLQTKKDATVEFLKSALDKEKGLPFDKTTLSYEGKKMLDPLSLVDVVPNLGSSLKLKVESQ
ncbi:hypothetical protein PROFUN_14887 [Planoprotostelium fungivorum]|uniref:Ubiquitin-like domain-containing protein n=1 Tax=Planoprotostelium fungivorum TaxID=1890364 RepID=A0A2P6MYI0_9EUKA|nr:hypothetical protein PROFUN_14887 [Planoprotostelium fungivorum]